MNDSDISIYICPKTGRALQERRDVDGQSRFYAESGMSYPIKDGVIDFLEPSELVGKAKTTQSFYDGRADVYDEHLHLTFFTHGEDERVVRNRLADQLDINPGAAVLEVAAGTGRDSEIIAARLRGEGKLFLQDISFGMLKKARERLAHLSLPISYALSSATSLPYANRSFDRIFSFGGLGEFPDIRGALKEMVRVCKVGGKIVVGDESIPTWLRHTEFAKILSTTNPQFLAPVPLDCLPVEARNVVVRWIIGGVFYVIEFTVGDGEPQGNFDYPIPGPRGGTLRTRYEGLLEGVSPAAKQLAHRARQIQGISMHAWLDRVVREAAERDIKEAVSR